MNESDEIMPEWARPLFAGPITFDENTPPGDLAAALEERLEGLLSLYNVEPTPEGWKTLALRLALDHAIAGKKVMEVRTPVDHDSSGPGRPPEPQQWAWIAAISQALSKQPGLSVKDAATRVKRSHKTAPSVARLQNLFAEARNRPRSLLPRLPWEAKIFDALAQAAVRLESRSRK
jgi:hypothetical protein